MYNIKNFKLIINKYKIIRYLMSGRHYKLTINVHNIQKIYKFNKQFTYDTFAYHNINHILQCITFL